MTDTTSYDNISIVVRQTNHNNGKCASGSAVEHLLAKEGVAGSIPVSRSYFLEVLRFKASFFVVDTLNLNEPLPFIRKTVA